ncbi:MAG TPA: 4'-phosphopantetheinyl transferase superfamily protein [Chloroflexi bacterium]|nr:4'-phosphopantetheinyl transferase superfamily protein [Chloroflexota bacterium]
MIDLDLHWGIPLVGLTLRDDQVHVWQAALEQPPDVLDCLAQALSPDELTRAECFHFARDRRRFIVSHGVLRVILGNYLRIDPRQVQFRYSAQGKPYLAEGMRDDALRFNLAHSHELAVYGFTRGREIGIDLEHLRPLTDAEEIVARFFSKRENAEFRSLPEGLKLEAFYNCWTRKEAYLKATGDGLGRALDTFDVSLLPGAPAALLRVDGDRAETTRWSLRTLVPDSEYVAALAAERDDWCVACWEWRAPGEATVTVAAHPPTERRSGSWID